MSFVIGICSSRGEKRWDIALNTTQKRPGWFWSEGFDSISVTRTSDYKAKEGSWTCRSCVFPSSQDFKHSRPAWLSSTPEHYGSVLRTESEVQEHAKPFASLDVTAGTSARMA